MDAHPQEALAAVAGTEQGLDKLNMLQRRQQLDEQSVLSALRQCDGHRKLAATQLGVSERTLYRYINKLRENIPAVVREGQDLA